MNITLRSALPQDTDGIGRVYCRAWQAGYAGLLPEAYLRQLSDKSCAPRSDSIRPEYNFVAEQNGTIVGVVNFGPARDKDAPPHAGELRTLYVLPAYWGSGTAQSLFFAAACALSRQGYSAMYLWVLHDNLRAQRFYEKVGMLPTGRTRSLVICGQTVTESCFARRLPC